MQKKKVLRIQLFLHHRRIKQLLKHTSILNNKYL